MRVLVVEDDVKTGEAIRDMIKSSGYVCDVTHTGQEGLDLINSSKGSYEYDVVVLDRMLKDMDGLDDFLPRLRCRNCQAPVMFLSAMGGMDDTIKALEFGADDYMAKPANKAYLISRLRALARRTAGHGSSVFKIGNMRLNFHKQSCTVGKNRNVPLTNKEYGMLELLCLCGPGAIVSKDKFINHLYSNNEPSDPKIIDVFMCKLRGKLAARNDGICYIETVWGRGYTLNENAAPSNQRYKKGNEVESFDSVHSDSDEEEHDEGGMERNSSYSGGAERSDRGKNAKDSEKV